MTAKLSSIVLLAAFTTIATAQTTAPKTTSTHRPAPTAAHSAAVTAPACSKLPQLSPKIPALPAGLPCAKPLYTITIEPNAKLEYISPLEGPDLRQSLGLESSSFSLDYIDVKVGAGELAAPHKWYTVQYTGYLVDGTKFDSSYDHPGAEPFTIAYGQHQVIPGWDTGFDGMRVGGKRRLFIPYQLAYGNNGKPPIPPKAELIFDVELVSQSDERPPKAPAPSAKPGDPDAKPVDPAAKPSTTPPPTDPAKPETTPHPQSL